MTLLTDLRRQEPDNPLVPLHLGNTYGFRAIALTQLKRHRESAADYDELIRLETNASRREIFRHVRLNELARAGEYSLATDGAEQLLRETKPSAPWLASLADVFAVSSAAVARDASVPLVRREKDAETWARQAVALLRQAADGGHFRDRQNVAWLRKNDELASLRGRDDFKRFLLSLEEKR
jgi:hypothetical protein